jgi:hypothetical protein
LEQRKTQVHSPCRYAMPNVTRSSLSSLHMSCAIGLQGCSFFVKSSAQRNLAAESYWWNTFATSITSSPTVPAQCTSFPVVNGSRCAARPASSVYLNSPLHLLFAAWFSQGSVNSTPTEIRSHSLVGISSHRVGIEGAVLLFGAPRSRIAKGELWPSRRNAQTKPAPAFQPTERSSAATTARAWLGRPSWSASVDTLIAAAAPETWLLVQFGHGGHGPKRARDDVFCSLPPLRPRFPRHSVR